MTSRNDKIRRLHTINVEWCVFTHEERGTVHVFPPNDWIEHHIDVSASECECQCEPLIEYGDGDHIYETPLVIHNAIDQREAFEK